MTSLTVARDLPEALTLLAGGGRRPLAGGVGVMLAAALGQGGPASWVAIGRIAELRELKAEDDGGLRIGSTVTIASLAACPPGMPALLARAASVAANPGIRAVGTIGGNIAGTGVRSDIVAALVALDAQVEIVATSGTRTLPVGSLWDGPDDVSPVGGPPRVDGLPTADGPVAATSELTTGALLRAVRIPPDRLAGWGWERVTTQGRMGPSAASVAVTVDRAGTARIVVTGVGARPLRFAEAETALAAAASSGDDVEASLRGVRAAVAAAVAAVPLRDDVIAPASYRRAVIPVLVGRAAASALARSAEGPS